MGPHRTPSTRRPASAPSGRGRRATVDRRRGDPEPPPIDRLTPAAAGRPLDPSRRATGRRSTSWCDATYADTYTLALRLTGNEEDARDVVQEAYLRAYRGLKRFRGDAQFTTWLYRITANCASTHARRSGAGTATTSSTTTWPVVDDRPERDPVGRADAGRPARPAAASPSTTCRPGCGPSSCSATSTTCPTRPSPPSWDLRVGGQGPPAPGPPQAPRAAVPGRGDDDATDEEQAHAV